MLTITFYPDPVLRLTAKKINAVTPEIRQLAADMLQTMYDANGIGLAAPQVSMSIRLVVIHIPGAEGTKKPIYLVNPVITAKSKEQCVIEEGCLSLPGISAKIKRPEFVDVSATDLDGTPFTIEAEGMLARCLQHEMDHLDGILFTDKASLAAKLSLRGELAELEEKFRTGEPVQMQQEKN